MLNWKFATALFILDRALKWYAQNFPALHEADFFSFGYFLNPALFFFPPWKWIPWLALIVFVVLLGWFFIKIQVYRETKNQAISYWLLAISSILLGGGSNVFDRFAFGGVVDYVEIFGLATINLADILILTGLCALIFKPKLYVQRS